ncbi:MAG: MFS transporter [Clostridia bacterium]|nr:MFS transporter [Clostridia bacterium]
MKTKFCRNSRSLTVLLAAAYMVSYLTRINFGAVISEMVTETGFSQSLLSLSLTGGFVTYGIGQIFSGILGDRISPKKLVCIGFGMTVLMNVLIPFCPDPYCMAAIWCLNGFAQSLMWPPIVKILTVYLSREEYKYAITRVSWGSSFGTILVYLLAPLLISFFGWRAVFFASALCGAGMLVLWLLLSPDASVGSRQIKKVKSEQSAYRHLFSPLMIGVMAAIVFQGILRDGVTTWMPSYLAQTYKLSNSVSILTGVVMPIFSILCFQIANALYVKKLTNPLSCGGVLALAGTFSTLGLYLCSGTSPVLSVFFTAVLIGCMHGVNLMLVCMIPPYFKRFGNVSTASGVINTCTYVGSALSTYGVALISEKFGWSITLFLWLVCAVLATLLCFLCVSGFRKKFIL